MQRTHSLLYLGISLSLAALFGIASRQSPVAKTTPPSSLNPVVSRSVHASSSYGKLPIAFESNQGQVDTQVKFLSHGHGFNLFLTSNEVVLALSHPRTTPPILSSRPHNRSERYLLTRNARSRAQNPTADAVLRMQLLGANAHPMVNGQEKLPGSVNYFIGNDPATWRTNIATYSRVQYKGVYPGIDMVYHGNQQQLEYDWVVTPGADVHQIQLEVQGAQKASLTAEGNLRLHTECGDVVQHAPVVYQEVNGVRTSVRGRLVLEERRSEAKQCRIGFEVAAYDHSRPLVIDPVLVYSSYLGGSGSGADGNSPHSIAVDSSGNAYIAGTTCSTDFPLKNALQSANNAPQSANAFITKINASGTALVYSTYLGGSGFEGDGDFGQGIAVDSSGNAYVTGSTCSADFPIKNALQSVNHAAGNEWNAFITKINPSGNALVYSTYLGGSNRDFAFGIAIDSQGNAYITGQAFSTDFPTVNALQSSFNANPTYGDSTFISKINATGSALVYSTYLGGSGNSNDAYAIAVDSQGNAYITGSTSSTDFPTQNPIQATNQAPQSSNAFVTKINANGSALVYSTYLGGSGTNNGSGDRANAIAVDSSGDAYVTGFAGSSDFPTVNAFQSVHHAASGVYNAFVTKINASGSALVYSTYLGGSGKGVVGDYGQGIAVDSSGNAYVTGGTASTDFPIMNAIQSVNNSDGFSNAFITEINTFGSNLIYSTYLGGSTFDYGAAIAVDSSGNAYVTGGTGSTDFPIMNAVVPFHLAPVTDSDPFVARIGNYNWQTVDVAVGSDNHTRLLWNNTTSTAGLWSVNNLGVASNLNNFGPYTDYAVQSLATGSDGLTRLLWNRYDHTAALWLLKSDNTYYTGFNFGPYADWAAIDVAVGSDNKARLLWNKSDGTAGIWTVDNSGRTSHIVAFGPYPGWQATRIAAGSDGLTRLLWTKDDGTAGLWLINADNTYNTGFNYGPYSGTAAIDVTVGSDNKARLLWTNADGQVAVWTIDNSGKVTYPTDYGPLTGYTATHIAAGSDGLTRLLWFKSDGTQALSILNSNNNSINGFTFGPY